MCRRVEAETFQAKCFEYVYAKIIEFSNEKVGLHILITALVIE